MFYFNFNHINYFYVVRYNDLRKLLYFISLQFYYIHRQHFLDPISFLCFYFILSQPFTKASRIHYVLFHFGVVIQFVIISHISHVRFKEKLGKHWKSCRPCPKGEDCKFVHHTYKLHNNDQHHYRHESQNRPIKFDIITSEYNIHRHDNFHVDYWRSTSKV